MSNLNKIDVKGLIIYIALFNLTLVGFIWNSTMTHIDKRFDSMEKSAGRYEKILYNHESRIAVLESRKK